MDKPGNIFISALIGHLLGKKWTMSDFDVIAKATSIKAEKDITAKKLYRSWKKETPCPKWLLLATLSLAIEKGWTPQEIEHKEFLINTFLDKTEIDDANFQDILRNKISNLTGLNAADPLLNELMEYFDG